MVYCEVAVDYPRRGLLTYQIEESFFQSGKLVKDGLDPSLTVGTPEDRSISSIVNPTLTVFVAISAFAPCLNKDSTEGKLA